MSSTKDDTELPSSMTKIEDLYTQCIKLHQNSEVIMTALGTSQQLDEFKEGVAAIINRQKTQIDTLIATLDEHLLQLVYTEIAFMPIIMKALNAETLTVSPPSAEDNSITITNGTSNIYITCNMGRICINNFELKFSKLKTFLHLVLE